MFFIFTKSGGRVFHEASVTFGALRIFAFSNRNALLFLPVQLEWTIWTFLAGVVTISCFLANAITERG